MVLLSLLLGLGLTAAYAAALTATAWRLGAQRGSRWLIIAWLVGGTTFCLLNLARFRVQGTPVHFPPRTSLDRLAIFASLGYGVVGAGATTLSVRKRLGCSTDGRLTLASIGAGVGAFFTGMLVVLLVVAINDVAALVQQRATDH
jgi:hypothetical protein